MKPTYDLLKEPLISVRIPGGGTESHSLPSVLALLGRGLDVDFPAFRPHQMSPWFVFLVQLAAMALARTGATAPETDEAAWRARLAQLADDCETAFCLVVPDLSRPAFMQPPVPEGSLDAFKTAHGSPDSLDILVTAKNHDVKARKMAAASPEQWAAALVTLQTMGGFDGRNNYGVCRMNGGVASRPIVSFVPSLSWGARFVRDTGLLLKEREEACRSFGFDSQGECLLWLRSWDGTKSFSLDELDPNFIEVCRRVRMTGLNGELCAQAGNSLVPRVEAKERKGDVGDPWIPIANEDPPKALTVGGRGFHYRLTFDLIASGAFKGGVACRPSLGDGAFFVGWALARGQGKTEGLHLRVVPLPRRVRGLLGGANSPVETLGKAFIEDVKTMSRSVLHPALCCLLQGGPSKLDITDERTRPWLSVLDRHIDATFFERLWLAVEEGATGDSARVPWVRHMEGLARQQLNEAGGSAPIPAVRKPRAFSQADSMFEGALRKHFPILAMDKVQSSSASNEEVEVNE